MAKEGSDFPSLDMDAAAPEAPPAEGTPAEPENPPVATPPVEPATVTLDDGTVVPVADVKTALANQADYDRRIAQIGDTAQKMADQQVEEFASTDPEIFRRIYGRDPENYTPPEEPAVVATGDLTPDQQKIASLEKTVVGMNQKLDKITHEAQVEMQKQQATQFHNDLTGEIDSAEFAKTAGAELKANIYHAARGRVAETGIPIKEAVAWAIAPFQKLAGQTTTQRVEATKAIPAGSNLTSGTAPMPNEGSSPNIDEVTTTLDDIIDGKAPPTP